jgi:hypothetical protein
MKKIIGGLVLCAALGCNTMETSYRPDSTQSAVWSIVVTKNIFDIVKVTVDGNEVISKHVGFFTGGIDTKATYKGKTISLTVSRVSTLLGSRYDTVVFIDGQIAAKVSF